MDTKTQSIASLIAAQDAVISRAEDEISRLIETVESLRREIEFAQVRKGAFEQALAAIGASHEQAGALYDQVSTTTAKRSGTTRNKPISAQWQELLRFIGFDGSTNTAVLQYAQAKGIAMQANAVRSQVSHLSKNGYLEKLGKGSFRLTDAGAEACGLNKGEAPSGANTEGFDLLNPPVVAADHNSQW